MWVDIAVKPTLNRSSSTAMMRKSNAAAEPLPSMKMSGVLVAEAPNGAAAAVSYTHLDVYKRQLKCR